MSQKLTFTTAYLLNTAIANDNDTIYFDIQTPEWEPESTTVRRLDLRTGLYEPTGRIRCEAGKPIAVRRYGGEFEPVVLWISKVDGTTPSRWLFDDGEGNLFAWCVAGDQLELYRAEAGTKIKRPLATFYQHKRYLYVGMISQNAYLEIDNSIVGSVDAIILSLLVVEQKRRGGWLV